MRPASNNHDIPAPQTSRLAPSPTGALHLGNARTFLVNWALARQNNWCLIMRIEDLDGPRIRPGAAEATLDILQWLGLDWDGSPAVQSDDLEPYREAMRRLAGQRLTYPCSLTRTEIADAASAPQEGVRESAYPPHLRPTDRPGVFVAQRGGDSDADNWRFVIPDTPVQFKDAFAGPQSLDVRSSVGDFILWTRRDQPSYQLAVVVDDARQRVTQVVRGNDLLDSAARQLLLYRALGFSPEPIYTHLPLVRGEDGRRLAKRHGDTRLESYRTAGVPATRIMALLARWSGCADRDERHLTGQEFVDRFRLDTMSRDDVIFTQEDHEWLLSGAP